MRKSTTLECVKMSTVCLVTYAVDILSAVIRQNAIFFYMEIADFSFTNTVFEVTHHGYKLFSLLSRFDIASYDLIATVFELDAVCNLFENGQRDARVEG